jgi:fatty acid desaturase
VEIVELPPLKRGVEWPTAGLAVTIYGLWLLATYFYRNLPWLALTALGAWIVAWQLNLQHEIIHGHPTRNRRVNEAIACWPLSLWLPYSIYRSTHLAHHRDANLTDPFEDPESYYWTEAGWRGLGPVWRAIAYAQTTLLGRVAIGPPLLIGRFVRNLARDAWRDERGARRTLARHLILCAPVLIWVATICGTPLWIVLPASSIPVRASPWCARSPSIGPCERPSAARRSSRTPGFWGRCSCSTISMWRTTCAIACLGTRFQDSTESIGRR